MHDHVLTDIRARTAALCGLPLDEFIPIAEDLQVGVVVGVRVRVRVRLGVRAWSWG